MAGQFIVNIAGNVPVGIYEIRVIDKIGASNARRFVVGNLAEFVETEENGLIENAQEVQQPTTINGQLETGNFDSFRFAAKKGQHLLLDCVAERLDARGDATMTLLSAQGKVLATSHNSAGHDPVISFQVRADGDYIVRLHELTYGSQKDTPLSPYRLTISDAAWIDYIDPPVGQRGKSSKFTLYGRNLGGKPTDQRVDGVALEALEVNIALPAVDTRNDEQLLRADSASIDLFTYRHKTTRGLTNAITIMLADDPCTREVEPNDQPAKPQSLQLPAEIVGTFGRPGDQDWFTFTAKKDEQMWLEVVSQRMGQPCDPLLVVQQVTKDKEGKEQTKELETANDITSPTKLVARLASDDPAMLFQVPEDGTYRILVRDQFGSSQGGPRYFYHLRVRQARPDFRLLAMAGVREPENSSLRQNLGPVSCVVRRGGGNEIMLLVLRREGFTGAVDVNMPNPPPGTVVAPIRIADGSSASAMLIRANPDAKAWTGPVQVVGKATIGDREVTRAALGCEVVWQVDGRTPVIDRISSRLVATIDETLTTPLRLQTKESKVYRMARGGKLPINFGIQKLDKEFKTNVSMTSVGAPKDRSLSLKTVNAEPAKPEMQAELSITTSAKVGRSTFFMRGFADIQYAHLTATAERVAKDNERINALQKEFTTDYSAKRNAKSKASQNVANMQRNVSSETNKVNTARSSLNTAQQQKKAANTSHAQAKAAFTVAEKLRQQAEAKLAAAADDAKNAANATLTQMKQQADQAKAKVQTAATTLKTTVDKEQAAADGVTKQEAALKQAQEAYTAAQDAEENGDRSGGHFQVDL